MIITVTFKKMIKKMSTATTTTMTTTTTTTTTKIKPRSGFEIVLSWWKRRRNQQRRNQDPIVASDRDLPELFGLTWIVGFAGKRRRWRRHRRRRRRTTSVVIIDLIVISKIFFVTNVRKILNVLGKPSAFFLVHFECLIFVDLLISSYALVDRLNCNFFQHADLRFNLIKA